MNARAPKQRPYIQHVVSERKSDSWSVAPNGSARCHDFYTYVTYRQDWNNTPESGIYAGRSYRIVERYISNNPNARGQLISSSSSPWDAK
jgi:hypothetical protein